MTLHDDLEKYEDFYNGNRTTIFSEFKTRWVDTANVASSSQFNERNFFFQNDIRVIQDTRVSFMPGYFDILISDDAGNEKEAETKKVLDWLNGPYFGGGRSFWEALPGYYKTHENYGTLFLMLTRKDGIIHISKLYSTDVSIITNPKNVYEVIEYRFEWEEEVDVGDEGTRNEQMKLIVDKTSYRTTQGGVTIDQQNHGFGFIPIVKIVRDEVDGTPYGRSGIEDLIEPQNEVNVALTKRAWATKHNSFQVYCPDGDSGATAGTSISITPGSFVPIPIKTVGGGIDMSAVENELNDALDHLYRIGSVPRKMKEETAAEASSAKALNTLLQSLKTYTDRKLVYLKRGFEEMISKAFGIDLKYVVITYPSDDNEDPEQVINRARFLSELGLVEESLRTLGYEDEAIKELMTQKEEADAERDAKAEEMRKKFMGDDESKDTSTEGQKLKSTSSSQSSDEQEETPSTK